jgi:hypothetical protein
MSDSTSAGFRTQITATLSVRDWDGAFAFYKKAFGAVELYRVPGGGVGKLAVDGAGFWVAEEPPIIRTSALNQSAAVPCACCSSSMIRARCANEPSPRERLRLIAIQSGVSSHNRPCHSLPRTPIYACPSRNYRFA